MENDSDLTNTPSKLKLPKSRKEVMPLNSKGENLPVLLPQSLPSKNGTIEKCTKIYKTSTSIPVRPVTKTGLFSKVKPTKTFEDLVLHWFTLKVSSTNPSMIKKLFGPVIPISAKLRICSQSLIRQSKTWNSLGIRLLEGKKKSIPSISSCGRRRPN